MSGPHRIEIAIQDLRGQRERIAVIRGDLTSLTGYGAATRALAAILRQHFILYGVDIHPEPSRAKSIFPGTIISDSELHRLVSNGGNSVYIINYSVPEDFLYLCGATNIGCFYWETSVLPLSRKWYEYINSMDYIWAPSRFVRNIIYDYGYSGHIAIVTWPFEFHHEETAGPNRNNRLEAMFFRTGGSGEMIRLDCLRSQAKSLFLTVKSLAPRKGLPIILSEWRDYVSSRETSDILLIKLRLVHNTRLTDESGDIIETVLQDVGYAESDPCRVAFLVENIPQNDMPSLYKLADAYVTASYGEGFGGPVIEALQQFRPVITARRTGAMDLIAKDYPLAFKSRRVRTSLRGNPSVYPHAATWELPVRGGMRDCIAAFSDMTIPDRERVTLEAREFARAACSKDCVAEQVGIFFRKISRVQNED